LRLFGDHKPADTLIGVARLARPEFLIEVDAIAVK
jgi:enamine deaminase RidA (YjgF/YER057c/UK114 family)